jgi:4-hydroxy-4-methyl-2-oxoglutarate aldolase
MSASLTSSQLESLRQIEACTLANAIETFHERLRNEGFADSSIHCLYPKCPAVIGYAVTIKVSGSLPPFVDAAPYPNRTDWWDYVLSVPTPRIAVVEDVSPKAGLGSLLGAVTVNILRTLGCVGAVTNGSVRDLQVLENLDFQIFAGSICVSHAYVHVTKFGEPVEVGGLKVNSGDLLHGDLHGVQTIPVEIAEKIPPVAEEITKRQNTLIELCQSKNFSLERLRAAIGPNPF